jgi:hypothetical protein
MGQEEVEEKLKREIFSSGKPEIRKTTMNTPRKVTLILGSSSPNRPWALTARSRRGAMSYMSEMRKVKNSNGTLPLFERKVGLLEKCFRVG